MVKMKGIVKKIVTVVCVVVAGLFLIGGAAWLFGKDKPKTLGASDYARYTLNAAGVANKDDKSGITTKEFIPLEEIDTIKLAEDAEVVYEMNYYKSDKTFVRMEWRNIDYDAETEAAGLAAEGIAYVRIEILPTADEDGEVGVFEKNDYVEQLTVTLKEVEKETSSESVEETSSSSSSEVSA